MIPILYSEQETNFNHNGIAALHDTIGYTVSEERNGLFEMQLEYPSGGVWLPELVELRLILAKPNDEDEPHLFRIYEITKNLEEQTVTVYAATKTNDLGGNLVKDVTITNKLLQEALDIMKADLIEPTPYNFISDIQTLGSTRWFHQNPLNCISGADGSAIDNWGGEIKRTNDTIFIYGRRGTDNITTIRQGKNIQGFTMTDSVKGLMTSILPFVSYLPKDAIEPVVIRGNIVNSELMLNYPVRYITPIDYSYDNNMFPEGEMTQAEYDAIVLANINSKAASYFTYQNPGCDKPKVTVEVDMMQLSDSSEYDKFKGLEHISLTDTVTVWVSKFNVDVEVKIIKVEYDGMQEQVTKITAGNAKNSLYNDVGQSYQNNIEKLKEYVDTVENGIYNVIRTTADGKNSIFSGYTIPDESLVKINDLWYKPVADGEVEMYRWNGEWILAVGNADKLVLGSIDANVINLVNLNASNVSTGTLTGANGAWNLNTGEFWIGSTLNDAKIHWDGFTLTFRLDSGSTIEEFVDISVGSKADNTVVNELIGIVDDLTGEISTKADAGVLDTLRTNFDAKVISDALAKINAENAVSSLDARITVLNNTLGDKTVKWSFIETTITDGEEGIFIGNNTTQMGVLIGTERISFMDKGTEVAYISNKTMQISHGIFVVSAIIGKHKIETIAGTDMTVFVYVG